MKNEGTITRAELTEILNKIASNIRRGALSELEVLNKKLFVDAPEDKELLMIWTMAGGSIEFIMNHLNDALNDIEEGRYLPRLEVTA